MIIFYKYNFYIFIISIIFLISCNSIYSASNIDPDLIELNITDIFSENIIDRLTQIPELNIDNYTAYSILNNLFEESGIYFFMPYNDNSETEDIVREIALIKSAAKASSFSIKKAGESTTDNYSIEETKKLFILLFTVKQLLNNCIKNINPLIEKIEQFTEEKRWDFENEEEEESSDLFFEIIELENDVFYLRKVKKNLLKDIAEISKILVKIEISMKHYSIDSVIFMNGK